MQRIKLSRFYIGLFVFVLLVVISTAIGNHILRRALYAYEAAQPKTAAAELIERLADQGRESELYRRLYDSLSPYEPDENKKRFLDAHLFSAPLELKSATSAVNVSDVQYALYGENRKIALLSLEQDETGGEFGFVGYHLKNAAFDPSLLQTISVSVPVGYTLFLYGIPVDAADASGEMTADESAKFMPDGVLGISRLTYRFSSLCTLPAFEVFSKDGAPSQIRKTDEDGVYIAALAYDEKLESEYADYAIAATKAYAAYMQNDRGFGAVKPYFDAQSELYEQLRTSATMWVIDHNGYSFSDEKATEFISYGEGVFSCRVSLTHTLTYPRLKDYHDYIDMTWYFHLVDGKYLIYNSFNNN